VLWDDWGGWYDHVVPPQLDPMGLGYRVPLLVISPYAKHGYVSHVQHEFGSILRFTEETFGLGPLGLTDARSDDLRDCFDFTRAAAAFHLVRTVHDESYFMLQPSSAEPNDPA
jgi:phospholipase C